ncbi:MAG: tRNA preQ1(34) S-adenosylmethionine ribosyltransferase-isomerase QueA [Rhodovibrionaceae bacterium]
MDIRAFDFDLPSELIAQHPAEPRDSARLLEIGETLADRGLRDLPGLLRPGDVMVFNDTKVIPARLQGTRPSGGKVEATLHKQHAPDTWDAFARPAKRLKEGDTLSFAVGFSAEIAEKREAGEIRLRFDRGGAALIAALKAHGEMPLPPYIRRPEGSEAGDAASYQTIYARHEGAVAAPTAGLHFTEALLAALDARGIERVSVTLHVGAGTFLPVKVEDVTQHRMHAEVGEIGAETARIIGTARREGRRIVSVGTTSLRILESAAAEDGSLGAFSGETRLFILPGYRFRIVDLLMTNFHLPRSTLFMLVSAFSGLERMQAAYAHAIAEGYRFFSYGDACLLHRMEAA